jgi:hypothetical protein
MSRLLLFLFLVFITSSCKKCDDPCNRECDNYDPCCGVMETNASFKIYENIMWPGSNYTNLRIDNTQFATDTVVFLNTVTFKADYDAEYYQWKVGNDPREWNTKEFNLRFTSVPFYTPILVTLKVYNSSDKICNPDAQDTATFTRTLITVPRDSSLIYGRFDGYIVERPNELLFFELKQGLDNDPFNPPSDTVRTILPDCEIVLNFDRPRLGYRNFYFWTPHSDNCCYTITTYGELNGDDIMIKFVHFDKKELEGFPCLWDSSSEIHGVFNGRRITNK